MKPPRIQPQFVHAFGLAIAVLAAGTSQLKAAWTLNASGQLITDGYALTASNLIILGDLSVWKGLDVGTASTNSGWSAMQVDYYNTTLLPKTASFDLTDPNAAFQWTQGAGTSPAKKKMAIDGGNILSLYNSTGTYAAISLNGGTGAITSNGSPVLTAASAANAFVAKGQIGNVSMSYGNAWAAGSTAMSGGFADGDNSTAISQATTSLDGTNATALSYGYASAEGSVAMSYGEAYGIYSTAMSGGYTEGESATAISGGRAFAYRSTAISGGDAWGEFGTAMSLSVAGGYGSTGMSGGYANGPYSTAMSGSEAKGQYSTAMSGGEPWGQYSTAAGKGVKAYSYSSASFGQYNNYWGSLNAWVDLDLLFCVGNGTGTSSTLRSNAISTLKNGQTTLTNKAWMANVTLNSTQTLADPPATATDSGGEALVVEGHTRLKGKVLIVPQGDLSMAGFEAGERP